MMVWTSALFSVDVALFSMGVMTTAPFESGQPVSYKLECTLGQAAESEPHELRRSLSDGGALPPPCGEGGAKRRVGVAHGSARTNHFAETAPHPTGLRPATLRASFARLDP